MRTAGLLFLFASLLLAGCTTHIHFPPHSTTNRPFRDPVSLGVYYTTGTLTRVEPYKNSHVGFARTWYVHVGEALEMEAFSRLRPRVERLVRSDSPNPGPGIDFVLILGISEFAWRNMRAETVVSAVLRGPDGVILLERDYQGAGSAQMVKVEAKQVAAEQGLGETTREAMISAVMKIIDDIDPYLLKSMTPTPAMDAK